MYRESGIRKSNICRKMCKLVLTMKRGVGDNVIIITKIHIYKHIFKIVFILKIGI